MMWFFWLVVALFCIQVPWTLVRGRSRFRRQASSIAGYVQQRGYALLNPSALTLIDGTMGDLMRNMPPDGLQRATAGITDIDPFDSGSDKNGLAFVCQLHSNDVTIFNFSTTPPIGMSTAQGSAQYRVAKIRHEGLPPFSLGRHSVVEQIQKLHDYLAKSPGTSLDRGSAPEFFQKYWLRGSDPAAVYAVLTPDKLRFLEQLNLAGTLAANAQYLVYFESQSRAMSTDQEYDSFIAQADGLIAHLL